MSAQRDSRSGTKLTKTTKTTKLCDLGVLCGLCAGAFIPVLLVSASGCRDSAPAKTEVPVASAEAPRVQYMSYEDARPVLAAFSGNVPAAVRASAGASAEAGWTQWTKAQDTAIRARLVQGDEDSVVNFWLYGTSFTQLPRATRADLARRGADEAEKLLIARLDDLIEALADPAGNERLAFVRQVIERHGIDITTDEGKDRASELLVGMRARMIGEANRHDLEAAAAARRGRGAALDTFSTIYRERGLSSDTSLAANFALDRALAALADKGGLGQPMRRVAIIGPGLDFTDKAEGYDLYPPQTIQPFALIDSLIRLKLAAPSDLRLTTFDLSPRVNDHLRKAVERARAGQPYVLQLPLTRDDPAHTWEASLESYWAACGSAIGDAADAVSVPPSAGRVDVRAVRVRPDVVASITPQDLNIVVQRIAPLPDRERFDLIVATNVLVYYGGFEQALALANVSAMLRPGGMLLTNYQLHPLPPMESSAGLVTPVFWDRQKTGDTMFGYRYVDSARRQ